MGPHTILSVAIEEKSFPARHGQAAFPVLQEIRFTLADQEILAIVGPSGCGKTTLLKLIGGLDTDFSGSIAWSRGATPRIGTVFQEPRLLPWRTVRQNIELVVPNGSNGVALEDLLRTLGLWRFRDAYPATLSLGMARRVAIARAFAIAPEILLLDEPFVSLDRALAERSRGVLLTAWRQRRTAALLVTHDLTEAVSLADRILMLSGPPAGIAVTIAVPKSVRRTGGEAAAAFAAELRRMAPPATDQSISH